MLEYDIFAMLEEIDVNKTSASRKCIMCHYWQFIKVNFKFQPGEMISAKDFDF